MTDIRSKRCVFVSHCMLAQGIMAEGVVKKFPAMVKPVIQFCMDHDINMFQMPCPETLCAEGGLGRPTHGKKWYEAHGLPETARVIAEGQVKYMRDLTAQGFEILAIIGVDFSPACAVSYLNRGRSTVPGEGIYVEALKVVMEKHGLKVPFLGVTAKWHKKMQRDLNALIGVLC